VASAPPPDQGPPRLGAGQVVVGSRGRQPEESAAQTTELYLLADPALSELRLDALLNELLLRIRTILGVDTAAILLLDPDSGELVARAAAGLEEEVRQGVRIPLGKGFAGRVAAERVAIFVPDVGHADVLNPILREAGVRSLLGVPLVAEGELVGVLHVGTLHPREFAQRDSAVLEMAAARAAPAIERARVFDALEREHRAAVGLQRSLLPGRLPDFVDVEVAVRYLPAVDEVGGDWYDVIPLEQGLIGVAIGDVTGHGVRAAALMGQLRAGMRAYALEGHPPASVLELLNRLLTSGFERGMATAAYGVFCTDTGILRLAAAGHPPPLVLAAGGARFEEADPDPPLGARQASTYREREIRVQPGEVVLLYTDGLIEARRERLDVGMRRLLAAAEAAGPVPAALCGAVVDEILGRRAPDDDVAVLALRNIPVPETLSMRLPADGRVLAGVRSALRRWLRAHGAAEDQAYDILLATGEACANAVEHAYGPRGGAFELQAMRVGQDAVVLIRDTGRWRAPRGRHRGRGIAIMRASMDSVQYRRTDRGTEVVLRRRIGGPAHAAG
jgi:serine phosphatase RsbU (regulator of sigma subunit)/anti-sigma regulatory factor (Ser/Thr protein kinase)